MIGTFSVEITSTNVTQRLLETPLKVNKVIIQAHRGNAGEIYIGDEMSTDQDNMVGFELTKPVADQHSIPFVLESTKGNDIELMDIWIAGTEDDIVNVTFWVD